MASCSIGQTETDGLVQARIMTPVGPMQLKANDSALVCVRFCPGNDPVPSDTESNCGHAMLAQAIHELQQYFTGDRRDFSIPLHLSGTAFQCRVWQALTMVPYGASQSYASLAAQIGQPKAVRAVGLANRRNPLAIFVPCHRIIGANGQLTGYAGGIEAKRWLLAHEQRHTRGVATGLFDVV